ncbi:S41 family peptidase [Flammeovirga kamogawensis]|uniref:Tricorn protease homolog n=1 Tax=Flammeovirga kamogawensis TaxID=373891 RepID=A0ABX8H2J1_9BACT|nr:S41 family peptidase [Flammeovirga kamogawensis]MBB6460314.1 Tol biopolymer transport system component [Flammeovirga kamogawensis]QWG10123.1 PD40 domain-containing protein [Flammeovirga kamogawensis]TRX65632.1 peptidase S41 [Flammeovirga kamogawensis]
MKKSTLLSSLLLLISWCSFANPLWMRYPAISPDGTHIAFAYQGDVYVVKSEGGEARMLTQHVAHDYHPVWSPDSKTIAFASDRHGNFDIFTVDVNGGIPNRLTYNSAKETPFSFTPDGKNVLFSAVILDDIKSVQFPYGRFPELYSVGLEGNRPEQLITTPTINAKYNKEQSKILYQDYKGYEDNWRKHHRSSVTRDIWIYDVASKEHTKLTTFDGEDLYPNFYDNESKIAYVSEEAGSANVWIADINGKNKKQITTFIKDPVRFLTVTNSATMCFGFDGEIYTVKEGEQPKKVNISIKSDAKVNNTTFIKAHKGGHSISVSPNGKELAFILRGNVFVTSIDYSTTVQITKTPEQERSVHFSPDGRKLVYAGERDNSWNIYMSEIKDEDEPYFINATSIEETTVTANKDVEEFQPMFSPKGDEIAYLEERTTLKVINLKSKASRTILEGKYNYSYTDGDQHYDWSPDGKWFAVQYSPNTWASTDIGLVDAQGDQKIINLTQSGYNSVLPKFAMDGKAIIFQNDKYGYRSHGSWGAEDDVFGIFLTKQAFDEFQWSKEKFEYEKKIKEDKEKKEKEAEEEVATKKKKKKKDTAEDKEDTLEIEFNNIQDRILRITINSSFLSDMLLTKDGGKLYYLSSFEGGYDLWVKDIRKNETKLLHKLSGGNGNLQFDKEHKNIYFENGNSFSKIELSSDAKSNISYAANYYLDKAAERAYLFEHVWRQVEKKFYDPEIHQVDWNYYKEDYAKFLPYINNNYDFSEMLSELLGELNGSHTGCRFYPSATNGDQTATFAAFFDKAYTGNGLKIEELIEGSPLLSLDKEIKAGMVIEKIDGLNIESGKDYYQLLNHKAGQNMHVVILDPSNGKRETIIVQPISMRSQSNLLYKRWVKQRELETEKVSNGEIGYVHVRGMNSSSFRTIYSEALGKNYQKKALIVDTRFNGGGWLHDDLATFLSGKVYAQFAPRGQKFGTEPINKWSKPSAVLVSEGNYSDAYGFPYAYKTLGIGKLIGMPIPGTMTAVWWESLQDNSLVFGIPQVGVQDMKGNYLENQQIEPDVKVDLDKKVAAEGKDQQLEKAVSELLK